MKTDFSPCPFCGPQQAQPQAFDTEEGSFIRCMSCGGSTDHYIDTESASEAWNTRAALTPPEDCVPASAVLATATRLRRLASAASPLGRKAYIKAAEDIELTVSAARPEVP